ncbi:MAG: fimbrillin family protein [Prevotella sp.]|nr:fimbrillin family protein [Bacteroides sp.]MCM1367096.1 fimbrillin family protein [Prevotella sp.]MCM1437361.1 fimbrillin family protein [Prevotella sp.]
MKSTHFYITCLLIALTAGSLSSCSNDVTNGDSPVYDDGAIHFAAKTEFTKSGDITTNNLESFNVYAYTNESQTTTLFMDNVEVTKTGTNTWTYSPLKYWPANGAVSFYAFAPAFWVGNSVPLAPIPYESYPGTEDIIYAVAPNLTGNSESANAQVVFNFRHALAKATVKLSSTNTDIVVKVSNVVMANIMSKGNFNFPEGSTSQAPTDGNVGTWTDQNTPQTYIFHLSQVAADVITLSSTPTTLDSGEHGLGGTAKYMIPQILSYRSNGCGKDTYLAIMCSVYDAKTGVKLWPNANTPEENIVEGSNFGDGLLKFSLSTSNLSAWQPGVHYIYNLVINSNEEMGVIEFGTPTIDTYVQIISNYE